MLPCRPASSMLLIDKEWRGRRLGFRLLREGLGLRGAAGQSGTT